MGDSHTLEGYLMDYQKLINDVLESNENNHFIVHVSKRHFQGIKEALDHTPRTDTCIILNGVSGSFKILQSESLLKDLSERQNLLIEILVLPAEGPPPIVIRYSDDIVAHRFARHLAGENIY